MQMQQQMQMQMQIRSSQVKSTERRATSDERHLGKGATATVKVMARKGHKKNDPLYAVKEFRKCGQHEDKQEYIKKVKSEYSIAASLHHPNIVCTYKLCTHNGRFNHVMEMCGYGELFTLVQKNYLGVQDNLCFFKQ
ncbi:hypothetical protein KEM52_000599, partial [Ascosphaera acerosa]